MGVSQNKFSYLSWQLMQLLPRGVQELLRIRPIPKRTTHRSSSSTSKSFYRCG
jgi:hypothetical protein